jgi:hypothetical protein
MCPGVQFQIIGPCSIGTDLQLSKSSHYVVVKNYELYSYPKVRIMQSYKSSRYVVVESFNYVVVQKFA